MTEPVLSGYPYDIGKARVLADSWWATIGIADTLEATPPDRLAACGILAARVMMASGLKKQPARATQALADFVAHLVSQAVSGGGPPP